MTDSALNNYTCQILQVEEVCGPRRDNFCSRLRQMSNLCKGYRVKGQGRQNKRGQTRRLAGVQVICMKQRSSNTNFCWKIHRAGGHRWALLSPGQVELAGRESRVDRAASEEPVRQVLQEASCPPVHLGTDGPRPWASFAWVDKDLQKALKIWLHSLFTVLPVSQIILDSLFFYF